MKEKSNYWDTQFTDLSQFLMAIQKLAEKKQETLQENKNKKAIENLTEPVKPLKKQRRREREVQRQLMQIEKKKKKLRKKIRQERIRQLMDDTKET